MGNLRFTASMDATQFEKALGSIEARIKGLKNEGEKGTPWFSASKIVESHDAFQVLRDIATSIIKVRSEFQQLETTFGSLLKSKSGADNLMKELVGLAATTPFELKDIADGAKQLIIFGGTAQTALTDLKMLGDVAAGIGMPVNELAQAYGALKEKAEVSDTQLQEFASRGIPIYAELAKVIGVNSNQIEHFVEAGKVGFEEVEQAFKNMTSQGGMFEGMMDQQSKTLQGSVTQLSNAFGNLFNELAKEEEGVLTATISGMADMINHSQKVIDVLKILIVTYGAYKAAVIVTALVQQRANIVSSINAFWSLARSIRSVSDAMALLNLVTNLNPYAVVVSAITAAVVAFTVFSSETKKLITAHDLLSDATKEVNAELNKQKGEISSLVNILKDQNAAESSRLEAYEKIIAINPDILKGLDFQKAKTADLTAEINSYIFTLEKKLRLEAASTKYGDLLKQEYETEEELNKASSSLSKIKGMPRTPLNHSGVGTLNAIDVQTATKKVRDLEEMLKEAREQSQVARQEYQEIFSMTEMDMIKHRIEYLKKFQLNLDKLSDSYKKSASEIKALESKLDKKEPKAEKSFSEQLAQAEDFGRLKLLKSLQKTDSEYDAYVKKIERTRGLYKQGSKEYAQLNNLLNQLKNENKSLTSGEAPAPFGSLAYWKEISGKASKALENLNPFKDSQKIKEQQAKKIEADRKAEELSKLVIIKSFNDILEEKRQRYEQYTQWVELKGRESADREYADLLKSGQSYKEFIDNERAALDTKVSLGTANSKDRENLLKLKNEALNLLDQELEEKKKQYELYGRWVVTYGKEVADEQFGALISMGEDYKAYLQKEISQLESKIGMGSGTVEDKHKLIRLKTTFEYENGGIEQYKQSIIETTELLGTLTERIALLNEEQAKTSPFDKERIAFLEKQKQGAEKQRTQGLAEYLKQVNAYEFKRKEIEDKFADLRAQLSEEVKAGRIKDAKEGLDIITANEKKALNELKELEAERILSSSQGYQDLQEVLLGGDKSVLKQRIQQTKSAMADLAQSGAETTEKYKELQKQLKGYQNQLLDSQLAYFSNVANVLSQVKSEYGGIIGGIGEVGELLASVSVQMGKMGALKELVAKRSLAGTDELKAETQKEINANVYAMILERGVDALNDLGKLIQQNKQKKKEYYDMIISQQQQYNLLLNDEIRSKSQSTGLFSAVASEKITDALNAQQHAALELNKAMGTLEKGQAKNGTHLRMNFWEGLKGAVMYGPTAALKGVETVDKLTPLLEKYPTLITKAEDGTLKLDKALAQTLVSTGALDEETTKMVQNALDWLGKYEEAQQQLNQSVLELTGQIGENLKNALVNAFKSGETAAKAFGDTVASVIENIITDALYFAHIKPILDRLTSDISASYKRDELGNLIGDGEIQDDIERFYSYGLQGANDFYKSMEVFKNSIFDKNGLEIFKKDGSGNSVSGSIKSISEETAGVLAGQMNAIRITQATNLEVNRNQLLALTKIANNSEYLRHLELLKSIDKKLGSDNTLRAAGVNA